MPATQADISLQIINVLFEQPARTGRTERNRGEETIMETQSSRLIKRTYTPRAKEI